MRSLLLASVLALAAVWGIVREVPEAAAQAAPHASRPREIESVSLDGDRLPAAALREVLATRAGEVVDAATLVKDRAALQAALAARGYLGATVAPAQVTFDDDGGAFVTFAIVQGREFHVRSVNVAGADARDAGVVTLAAGAVASQDRIEQERQALATRLAARGKPATVTVEMTTDEATNAVDVTLIASR